MPLNKEQVSKLKEGTIYKIAHERKGHFVGMFLGYDDEPFRLGDKIDDIFLTFKYDVRVGTAQAHLSLGVKEEKTGQPSPVRVSNLRPSLVIAIEKTKEQEWLKEISVPEEKKPKNKNILSKVFGKKD